MNRKYGGVVTGKEEKWIVVGRDWICVFTVI